MLRSMCLAMVALVPASAGSAQQGGDTSEPQPDKPPVLERLARRLEPDLVGQPERLPQYVDFYQREFGNDARLFCLEVVATAENDNSARLTGFVEFPEMRKGLVEFLGLLGFSVVDELESLPAADLGERTLGILKTSHSLSYDRPGGERSVVTDCLLGDRLYLLREDQNHLLVHSQEGYLGYVLADDVLRTDEPTFVRYMAGPEVRVITEHRAESGLVIPVGARLKWIRTEGETTTAELPLGELVALPAASCKVQNTPVAEIDRIVQYAQAQLGTPYVWGGKTSSGIDCSGLVQIAFSTIGLNLPRDSNQQFLLGALTATRWNMGGMRRGDTLYFLGENGKIRHTAIYLGDDHYLQAEMPAVNIRSLNPNDDDYDPKRGASFAFAKRLLD